MIGFLPDMPPGETKFQTARTRNFRTKVLSEEDERTISHIEEFGCSVVSVKRTKYGLCWSYTVGLFDTSGQTRNYHCRIVTRNRTLCVERGCEAVTRRRRSHYGPTP